MVLRELVEHRSALQEKKKERKSKKKKKRHFKTFCKLSVGLVCFVLFWVFFVGFFFFPVLLPRESSWHGKREKVAGNKGCSQS